MNNLIVRGILLLAVAGIVPACGGGGDTIIVSPSGPASGTMVALTDINTLLFFDASTPGTILNGVAVTGLQAGESLVGIDYRPATGELFGLGVMGTTGRVYVINPITGFARSVAAVGFSTALGGSSYGFDFNPTVDRIRVVNDVEQNLRVNPNTGLLAGTDTNLSPPGFVGAVAYTNNFVGATLTALFGIDVVSNQLVLIGGLTGIPSPNGGVVTPVGPLGIDVNGDVGFDIAPGGTAYLSATDAGGPGLFSLYTVDLVTGAATLVGAIGNGSTIRGLTVVP